MPVPPREQSHDPEQFLLHVGLVQRTADDMHERPGSTRALAMDLAGDRLLSTPISP